MVNIKIDMRGLKETLKFWEQGSKPLHFEGQVGSDLAYALYLHEDPSYNEGAMLLRDIKRLSRGLNPATNKPHRWGEKRVAKVMGDTMAKWAIYNTPQPEGKPGKKYLTRAANYHLKMYTESAQDILPHAIALLGRNTESNLANAVSVVCDAFLRRLVIHLWGRATALAPIWHEEMRKSLEGYVEGKLIANLGKPVELTKDRLMEKPPNVKKMTKEGLVLLSSLENA